MYSNLPTFGDFPMAERSYCVALPEVEVRCFSIDESSHSGRNTKTELIFKYAHLSFSTECRCYGYCFIFGNRGVDGLRGVRQR